MTAEEILKAQQLVTKLLDGLSTQTKNIHNLQSALAEYIEHLQANLRELSGYERELSGEEK